jgi:hypothetical protein
LRNDNINISQEISKTHIWKDLVNSDKHLPQHNNEPNKRAGFSMASFKLRKSKQGEKDAAEHTSSGKPAGNEAAPLLNNQAAENSNSVPTIVIDNNYSDMNASDKAANQSAYYRNRKEFFSKDESKL